MHEAHEGDVVGSDSDKRRQRCLLYMYWAFAGVYWLVRQYLEDAEQLGRGF